jgi:hypothetical protein
MRAGQDTADRDAAIRHVDMQLLTTPDFVMTLGILLRADTAGARQIGEHGGERLGRLACQAARRLGDTRRAWLVLAWATPFAALLGLLGPLDPRRPLARVNGAAVPHNTADQPIRLGRRDHRRVRPFGQRRRRELGERPTEGGLARQFADALPAA